LERSTGSAERPVDGADRVLQALREAVHPFLAAEDPVQQRLALRAGPMFLPAACAALYLHQGLQQPNPDQESRLAGLVAKTPMLRRIPIEHLRTPGPPRHEFAVFRPI